VVVGKATDGDQLACLPKTVPVLAVNVPYPGKSLSLKKSKNIYIASQSVVQKGFVFTPLLFLKGHTAIYITYGSLTPVQL